MFLLFLDFVFQKGGKNAWFPYKFLACSDCGSYVFHGLAWSHDFFFCEKFDQRRCAEVRSLCWEKCSKFVAEA